MITTRHILPGGLNHALRQCLLYSGSMTQYLSAQFNSPLIVTQRAEYRVPASLNLQTHFNIPRNSALWQRDVILSIGKLPVMFARSYMPYDKAKQVMQALGDQPLGTWLFSTTNVRRSPFVYFRLPMKDLAQYELLHTIAIDFDTDDFVWARQSDFFLQNTKLQLLEVFLPAMHTSMLNLGSS